MRIIRRRKVYLKMRDVDFYMADLSYATIRNVKAKGVVFYKANLNRTVFKNCDLRKADFRGANIDNAKFDNCNLEDAKFNDCIGVAKVVITDKNRKETTSTVGSLDNKNRKKIFISCLGTLSNEQSALLQRLEMMIGSENIVNKGTIGEESENQEEDKSKDGCFDIRRFEKPKYRDIGQLSTIRSEIEECDGVIALGFVDIHIDKGISRKGADNECARVLGRP